jgi:hypothetical protein
MYGIRLAAAQGRTSTPKTKQAAFYEAYNTAFGQSAYGLGFHRILYALELGEYELGQSQREPGDQEVVSPLFEAISSARQSAAEGQAETQEGHDAIVSGALSRIPRFRSKLHKAEVHQRILDAIAIGREKFRREGILGEKEFT